MTIDVLVSLHRGYGLGDAVQMSAVLRHVTAARPNWRVHYQAEQGRHQVGEGIVARHFGYGMGDPSQDYDAEVQILLFDTFANWGDRPNTRVSSCLHERFGLPWLPEYGRYQVCVRPESRTAVRAFLYGVPARSRRGHNSTRYTQRRVVAIHYQGDSAADKKDLTHTQAAEVCEAVMRLGAVPLVLDWRSKCPLAVWKARVPQEWGRDAEMVTALIAECSAFVGIDSGPAKCASATETPSLVVWTGHHPAPFHDPAPNTMHLVPLGYHGLEPVCNDRGVIEFFERSYNIRTYDHDPVVEVQHWLGEVF